MKIVNINIYLYIEIYIKGGELNSLSEDKLNG